MLRMGKRRTVKVEANGVGGTVLRCLYPHKTRVGIDEAPDQPRTGYAIDPHPLPGGPPLVAIAGPLQMPDTGVQRPGSIWRAVAGDSGFGFGQGLGTLGLGRAREVVDRHQGL